MNETVSSFEQVFLLLKKYNSWYFFKKAICADKIRLTLAIVCTFGWFVLAVISIVDGLMLLAVGLFVLISAFIFCYSKLIKRDYPKFSQEYADIMFLYDERDNNLKILSIAEELKKEGNLTNEFLNSALEEGKALAILKPSQRSVFSLIVAFILGLIFFHSIEHIYLEKIIAALAILISINVFSNRFFDADIKKYNKVEYVVYYLEAIKHYIMKT